MIDLTFFCLAAKESNKEKVKASRDVLLRRYSYLQAIQLASLKQNRLLHATGITSALRTSQEAGLGLFDHIFYHRFSTGEASAR